MSLGFIIKSVSGLMAILDCKRTLPEILRSKENLSIATQSVKTTVNAILPALSGYGVCGKNALSQTKGHGIYSLSLEAKDTKKEAP